MATESSPCARRLVVNADDFGRSDSINEAVIRAHREGILTTASLMVNEPASEAAVRLARENPGLGVGLHLTLLCGHSALPHERIPGLVAENRQFARNPVAAGFRYFFQSDLRPQLRSEIRAQFDKFRATGLPLDHVNGHLHLHLHPAILPILLEDIPEAQMQQVRLTFDPFRLNLRLARGRLTCRALHAVIFHILSARARPVFRRRGIRHTGAVFGLLQNALVDEAYVCNLLPRLPAGDSELYSHPSVNEFRNELDALVSPRVRRLVADLGIKLIRYQDL
jgi:hopanoid biosynthesis associated protein HpnK